MSYNVFQSLSKTGGMFFHHEKMQPFSLTVDIKLFLETICICNSFEYTSYVFQKQSGFFADYSAFNVRICHTFIPLVQLSIPYVIPFISRHVNKC